MTRLTFEGQVAVVTGAGAGLGRGYAVELASRGAAVVVNDIAQPATDEVVDEIEASGGRAAASYESVSTSEGGRAIVEVALQRFGSLQVLINNAGFVRGGCFESIGAETLNELLQVHLGAAFYVTQPAWSVMRQSGYGRVVLTGSTAGMAPMRDNAAYTAAKAGIHGLGRALALEGRPLGILVNTVMPSAPTQIASTPSYGTDFPSGPRAFLAPRRTVASVVALVVFLASRGCSLSGETFSAAAGRYARMFTAVTGGWVSDPLSVQAEDIAAHVGEILREEGSYSPSDFYDEMTALALRLGYTPAGDA